MSDADDDSIDIAPIKKKKTPNGRVYVCLRCGRATRVSGGDYQHICDPFWLCTGTYCCGCAAHVPLSEVQWRNTGEIISEYRRRLRGEAPLVVRLWRYGLGALPGIPVGCIVGLVVGLIADWPAGRVLGSVAMGGVLGAVATYLLGGLVIELILGIDYCGTR